MTRRRGHASALAGVVAALSVLAVAACSSGQRSAAPTPPPTTPPPTTTPQRSAPATTPPATTAPATGSAAPSGPLRYVFPISPASRAHFSHSHHDYPATDVFARCGTTFVAATSGEIVEASTVDRWNAKTDRGADRGGLSVMLLGDDGVRYYGSHLSAVQAGITVGRRVAAGDVLGKVGRSGNAAGIACHVHFGLSPVCDEVEGEWWIRRGTVYPWPYLESWRKGGTLSPVKAVHAWHDQHGCPAKPSVDP